MSQHFFSGGKCAATISVGSTGDAAMTPRACAVPSPGEIGVSGTCPLYGLRELCLEYAVHVRDEACRDAKQLSREHSKSGRRNGRV